MHDYDWKSFEKTGCVIDYLRYKGIASTDNQIENKAEEMRECTNAESGNSDRNYHQIRTY